MSGNEKFINLDDLVDEKVIVQFNGEKHEMKQMTVADFVWVQKEAAKVKSNVVSEDAESEAVDEMIDIIIRQFPTMTKDMLKAARIKQLMGLVSFMNNLGAVGAPGAVAAVKQEQVEGVADLGNS